MGCEKQGAKNRIIVIQKEKRQPCLINQPRKEKKTDDAFLLTPFSPNAAICIREHSHMTSDVFGLFLTCLPTYPNQILYYISLFSKIRCSLIYLLTYPWTSIRRTQQSDVICECSLNRMYFLHVMIVGCQHIRA